MPKGNGSESKNIQHKDAKASEKKPLEPPFAAR